MAVKKRTNKNTIIHKYKALREKMLIVKKYREDNRLYFMDFNTYKEQSDIYNKILERAESKTGPYIFVIWGGNRSGKSETGAGAVSTIAVNKDLKYGRNLRIWCATLADLSIKVQQRKINDILPKSEIEYGNYNGIRGYANRTIITKSKSTIYFKTYDQGESAFQGDDIDVVWFDEECPYSVFLETLIRLGDRSGCIILTFTSLMGFTKLVNKLWGTDDPTVYSAVLTAKKNPFLSDEVKKQLYLSIDPDERESRWDGKPHIKTGLIYKSFCDLHRINRFDYFKLLIQYPHRFRIHECIDPHNRTPHHWLRFLYDIDTDVIYIVEELKAPSEAMPISDFAKLIKLKRYGITPDICQIDTSSESSMPIRIATGEEQTDVVTIRTEFRKYGIDTILCIKDNNIGISSVNARLRYYKDDTGGLLKKPRLYCFNDCNGTIWEFTRYSWGDYKTDKTAESREQINTPLKKNDHFMDCLKYEAIYVNVIIKNIKTPEEYNEVYPGTGF